MPWGRHGTLSSLCAAISMGFVRWPFTPSSLSSSLPPRIIRSKCGTFRRQLLPKSEIYCLNKPNEQLQFWLRLMKVFSLTTLWKSSTSESVCVSVVSHDVTRYFLNAQMSLPTLHHSSAPQPTFSLQWCNVFIFRAGKKVWCLFCTLCPQECIFRCGAHLHFQSAQVQMNLNTQKKNSLWPKHRRTVR